MDGRILTLEDLRKIKETSKIEQSASSAAITSHNELKQTEKSSPSSSRSRSRSRSRSQRGSSPPVGSANNRRMGNQRDNQRDSQGWDGGRRDRDEGRRVDNRSNVGERDRERNYDVDRQRDRFLSGSGLG